VKVSKHFDVYYDGPQLNLSANNCWLRFRDQEKISLRHYVNQGLNEVSFAENWVRFYDLDDKHAILAQVKQLLAFEERKTRRRSSKRLDALDVAWLPFAHFPFVRTELEMAYGTILVDEMAVSDTCDDFYAVGHIKVNNSKDVPKALAFLKALELESGLLN
jgi:hypothetical protein